MDALHEPGGQATAGADTADGQSGRVDAELVGVGDQPGPGGVAVVVRDRVGVTVREAVLDRDDDDPEAGSDLARPGLVRPSTKRFSGTRGTRRTASRNSGSTGVRSTAQLSLVQDDDEVIVDRSGERRAQVT